MTSAAPSQGWLRANVQVDELNVRLAELLAALRRRRKLTRSKRNGRRGRSGDGTGADILGGILGDPVTLDYGGSAGLEADNPFNPTTVTPIGTNPAGKP